MGRVAIVQLTSIVLFCAACSSGGRDFEGRYSGDGVELTLKKQSGPLYNGTLVISNKRYPIVVKAKGEILKGKFQGEGGKDFEVGAKVQGATLELTSGGKTFKLKREGGEGTNPLAKAKGGKPATAAKHDNPLAKHGAGDPKKPAEPKATPKASTGFAGEFSGSFAGNVTRLSTKKQGEALSGTLRVGSYVYKLAAKVEGKSAKGKLVDPKMGGAIPCSLSLAGDAISVRFAKRSFTLRRGGAASVGPASTAGAGEARGTTAVSRDRRLVGLWTRTDGMSSGGASYASKQYLEIGASGSFRTGAGKTVGGGAGWSMGGGSGVTITGRGKWKSSGRVVYVNSGSGWSAYARYYTTGAKLMFTFANGSRQIWYRSR